uniref:Uncharacterized protein n=1 Tax=Sinocyclocheilus grahami TaxID=75366 RepID=A0A672MW08_SINGR
MKVEETKLKEQEVTVTLPKFGISLPKVEAHKPTDSVDKEESTIDPRESNADSDQAEKDPRTPTKIKRPTIKFPKVGVSFPKSTDAVSDNQMPEVTKDEPAMEIKALETELPTESPSLPEMKTPHIILSVSKPEVDVSTPEVEKAIDEHSEKKKEKVLSSDYAFSKPEVKMSLVGHGLDQETAIEGLKMQASNLEAEVNLPSGSVEEVILEAKEKEISQATLESKIDQEVGLKDTGMKIKKTGFSLPKFGFSKPDIKAPEIDVSLAQVDTSKPESDLKIKEQTLNITVSNVEDDQKDTTALSATAKFPLPSINIPKIGGQATKEEKTMPVVDIAVKGPEVIGSDTQIKISGEAPSVDIKRPHLATEGQSVSVDLNVEDAELGGQGGKFKMPKFGIGLPKVKGFDLSTSKTDDITEVKQIHITKPAITTEGMVQPPEQDSKFLDVQIKPSPEFGFSKPEIKAPEVDVSIQKTDIPIPEGSMDLEEINVDIKVSKMESDQKGSTIFGSPTKFKLPSISFPKFGVKSQKLEGTNIKTDISKPDVKLEVQTPKSEAKVEGSADMPEVDSKGLQVKVKRSSFSFPKFGFSKPDTATPEVNISVPKAEVSIPEVNVPVKEQTAQVTLPGGEAEQKDLMIVSSPTKFKLPEVNLPKFGVKTSKGTVSLPSADKDIKGIVITVHEPDIKLSGQIQKTELDVKEIETDIHATIRETDVHLAEGKVILPQPDVDVQDISIEGKADMSEVDLKGHDVKLKKPSFSLPKFGFSKTDIKGQDVDAIQPKADMFMQEDNIPVEDKDAEITITDELPSFNLPKFGLKYPKATADIPAAEVDIKEPEISFPEKGEVQTTDTETNIDIKGPSKPSFGFPNIGFSKSDGKSQDIQATETTADISLPGGNTEIEESEREGKTEITGPKFGSPTKFKLPTIKLPKFGLSAPKVPSDAAKADSETKEIKVSSVDYEIETSKLDPSGDIKGKTAEMETPSTDIDIKEKELNQEGQEIKFKLPKFGISLPKVKGPEVTVTAKEVHTETPEIGFTEPEIKMQAEDASLPKVDMALQESSSLEKKEVETELKDDTVVSGSPSKFKLPTFKMPKFGISTQKTSDAKVKVAEVDVPDANTDLNIEDKPIQMSKEIQREGEIKEITEQLPDTAAKKLDGDKGSPSKFKFPTIKMPKISISRTKSQEGEDDTTSKVNAPDAKIETKDDTQGPGKSPKFTMPTFEDVLRGFEVEFNVPTIEEMEAQKDKPSVKQDQEAEAKVEETAEYKDKGAQEKSKFKFKFPTLGFSQSSDESDKLVDAKIEESEKHLEASADQKATVSKEQAKTEKGGWFKFSFSSPTKTSKTDGKEIIQPPEEAEKLDDVEKESSKAHEEPEKISLIKY